MVVGTSMAHVWILGNRLDHNAGNSIRAGMRAARRAIYIGRNELHENARTRSTLSMPGRHFRELHVLLQSAPCWAGLVVKRWPRMTTGSAFSVVNNEIRDLARALSDDASGSTRSWIR